MRIKRLVWIIPVIAVLTLPLAAQVLPEPIYPGQGQTGTTDYTPFVSGLQGEIRNNLVRLSWVDSPDARGPVYIYRSSLPFDGMGPFPEARHVEIPYGALSYIDEIETDGIVYYFVAASAETGRIYDIPIGFTNTISIKASINNTVPSVFFPAVIPAPAERSVFFQTGITSLEARVQSDRIIITFLEGNVKSATLYRSTRPITGTQDLLGAVIIQTKTSSPFTDYPVPGIPYYYAVISEDDLIRGSVEIIPGRNVTQNPIEISPVGTGVEGRPQSRDIRAMPLPQMSIQAAVPGVSAYNEIPNPMELSPLAAKVLGPPLLSVPAQQESALKNPRVFARDMETSPQEVEEFALSSVVNGNFAGKNWEAAKEGLIRFLALPRKPEVTERARFYLGQCYYFLRRPREALFEFLAIRDKYPAESMDWIQASLKMMNQ